MICPCCSDAEFLSTTGLVYVYRVLWCAECYMSEEMMDDNYDDWYSCQ